jgi:hypothetical protein
MIAGIDCTNNVWRVFIPELPNCSGAEPFCASSAATTGWISSRTAIVGDMALPLGDPTSPEKVFRYTLALTGIEGQSYVDAIGRTWTTAAQAGVVFRKLKADCLRLTGRPLSGAVLAVPEGFRDPDKLLLRAAWMADLNVNRIVFAREAALYSCSHMEKEECILLLQWDEAGFHATTSQWDGSKRRMLPASDKNLGSGELTKMLRAILSRKVRSALGDGYESEKAEDLEDAALHLLDEPVRNILAELGERRILAVLSQEEWVSACREFVGAALGVIDRSMPSNTAVIRQIILAGTWSRFPGLRTALTKRYGARLLAERSEDSIARGAANMSKVGDTVINRFVAADDRFRTRVGYCYVMPEGQFNVLFEPLAPIGVQTEHPLPSQLKVGQEIILCSYERTPEERIMLFSLILDSEGPWLLRAELRAPQELAGEVSSPTKESKFPIRTITQQQSNSDDAEVRDWIRTLVIQ